MATITWNFDIHATAWTNPSLWIGDVVPGSTDIAVVVGTPSLNIGPVIDSGVNVAAGGLTLGSSALLQDLGTLTLDGAAEIAGTIDLGLLFNSTTIDGVLKGGSYDLAGGQIIGTTLSGSNPVVATLDGVTLGGDGAVFGTVAIADGLSITSPMFDFSAATLELIGPQSIQAEALTGFLHIESAGTTTLTATTIDDSGKTFTLASATGTTGTLVLDATLLADDIDGDGTAVLVNEGQITLTGTNGGTQNPQFSHLALDNRGTLVIASGAQYWPLLGRSSEFLNSGLIHVESGGLLVVQPNASPTLGPVSNTGTILLDAGAQFVAGALVMEGAGTVIGAGGTFSGSYDTLTLAGTLVVGSADGFLDRLVVNSLDFAATDAAMPTLDVLGGIVGSGNLDFAGVALTLTAGASLQAPTLTLDTDVVIAPGTGGVLQLLGTSIELDGNLTGLAGVTLAIEALTGLGDISGVVTNNGTIVLVAGEHGIITGSTLNGTGAISLGAGSVLTLDAAVALGALAAFGSAGGTVDFVNAAIIGGGGTLDLTTASVLNGASIRALSTLTLIEDGGSLAPVGLLTLDAVTVRGPLMVGADDEQIGLINGTTLLDAAGTGDGTITLGGTASGIDLLDAETLDSLVINVGTSAAAPAAALAAASVGPASVAPASVAAASTALLTHQQVLQIRQRWQAQEDETLWKKFHASQQSTLRKVDVFLRDFMNIDGVGVDFGGNMQGGSNGAAAAALGGSSAAFSGPAIGVADIDSTSFENTGTISALGSYAIALSSPTLSNDGLIAADGGIIDVATSLAGGGTLQIDDGGGLALEGGVDASQTIMFAGAGALQVFQPQQIVATIEGFGTGDYLDLANIVATAVSLAPGELVALNGSVAVATLHMSGSFTPDNFVLSDDLNGGTYIDFVACFAAGTRIGTPSGPVPVERLRVGDVVLTARGAARPVRWVGHRRLAPRRHPRPHDVQPVRVAAGAVAPGVPARNLRLSPDHAVHLAGALIPVRYLLNDQTIVQEDVASVEYWHVELDSHDVLLAEALPCESFLDTGNRAAFEGGGALMLHPDFALGVWARDACAPLVRRGAVLREVRASLLTRADALGHAITPNPALRLMADGQALAPDEMPDGSLRFRLPGPARSLRLISRAVVPARLMADHADHRRLGVRVSRLVIDGRERALSRLRGRGWHAPEGAWRWTDGDAVLPPSRLGGPVEVAAAPFDAYPADGRKAPAVAAGAA